MAHADEVGGKIGEYLRAALDQLPLSRDLATIRRDLDLDISPEISSGVTVDEQTLVEVLKRYEFNSWLQELGRRLKKPERGNRLPDHHRMSRLEPLSAELEAPSFSPLIPKPPASTPCRRNWWA